MEYSNPRLEGRSWPARPDLKWQCPECDSQRATKQGLGSTFSGSNITPGVAIEYTNGSYEAREVACDGCNKKYRLSIEMDGNVRIDHRDVPEELWASDKLVYNAADDSEDGGWAGQR